MPLSPFYVLRFLSIVNLSVMAEKTLISSSQESLPLSEETCLMLLNDLGDSFNTLMTDDTLQVGSVLNTPETLEERLEKMSKALTEEEEKNNHLSRLNEEMSSEIHKLNENLQNEIKGRQELEQVRLLVETRLKEQLKEKEIQISELQKQLIKHEVELNQTRLICYEEAAAKARAFEKLHEIESHSYHIHDLVSERETSAQAQKPECNEEDSAFGELQPMEQIEDLSSNQFQAECFTNTVLKTSSSLPATESWPGQYNFRVSFTTEENVKAQWVYSALRNKLYVKKDAPCPINFCTNTLMLDDYCIRTMPFFSSADHVLDRVHRCVNHSMVEIQNNKPEAEHLVRVESLHAFYDSDQTTGRHSVVVPYENPPAGQQFSRYIFKFACFQSCSGGPNRRPLMLCFTLERRGIIVGRQKVYLKICACPLRDSKLDEKPSLNSSENQPKKKCVKREREESYDTPQNDISVRNYDMPPVKLRPGPYYLKVDDRRNYEILKFIAKVCLQPNNQPLCRSNLINLIQSTYASSSEEEERK